MQTFAAGSKIHLRLKNGNDSP